jgi:hypothetical protein
MTTLNATSSRVAMNITLSDFSFLAILPKDPGSSSRNYPRQRMYDRRERSTVISRARAEAPTSQTGAAWVPSSQSSTARTD